MLRLILTFIVISGIFTLDIYLPGVPEQIKSLGVSNAYINFTFTFTMFSVIFALSQLIAGPLSDRYGRKPILIAGLSLAILATFLCGFIQSYWQLLLLRIIQAIGASCLVVANAIVRDLHDGLTATRLRGYITMVAGVNYFNCSSCGLCACISFKLARNIYFKLRSISGYSDICYIFL